MTTTVAAARTSRTGTITLAVLAGALGACLPHRVAPPAPPEPVFYIMAVPASIDSTIAIARTALREINGQPQQPAFANNVTSVTTHYTRTREDGGETRVAMVVEVSHKVADPTLVVTGIRLSAWALDYPGEFLNRSGPSMSSRRFPNAAAVTRENVQQNNRPRAITEADISDVEEMTHVLEALMRLGARPMRSANAPVETKRPSASAEGPLFER